MLSKNEAVFYASRYLMIDTVVDFDFDVERVE